MNEVEKMYKNAHVYPRVYGDITKETFENKVFNMTDMCNEAFTAEKQLELYKYLCKPFLITTRYYFDEFSMTAENTFEWKTMTKVSVTGKTYEECIAKLVNDLWQDLTEEERTQIKEILE